MAALITPYADAVTKCFMQALMIHSLKNSQILIYGGLIGSGRLAHIRSSIKNLANIKITCGNSFTKSQAREQSFDLLQCFQRVLAGLQNFL